MRKCVLLAVIGVQIIMLLSFVHIVKHISSEKQLLLNLSNASKLITWSCTECCEIAIEDITDYSAKEIAEKNDYYKIYRCRFSISNGSDYEISGINVYSPDGKVEMNLYPFSYGDTGMGKPCLIYI